MAELMLIMLVLVFTEHVVEESVTDATDTMQYERVEGTVMMEGYQI